MKRFLFLSAVAVSFVAFAQVTPIGRWDGTFQRKCRLSNVDAGEQCCALTGNGAYVLAYAIGPDGGPSNFYAGNGVIGADGGPGRTCLLADAGLPCQQVYGTIGLQYYSQLRNDQRAACVYSALTTSEIWIGEAK